MDMTRYRFRTLAPGDRPMTERFFADLGEAATGLFNVNRGNERRVLEYFENGKPDHRFFVTVDTQAATPTAAGLCFYWDLFSSVPWMGIAVADAYRGQHLGSFTLDNLLQALQNEGRGGVLLRTAQTNLPAQRLYESRGFERLGVHASGEFLYIKRFPTEGTWN